MLTKSDLQAIQTLIKDEVNPLKQDMAVLKKEVKPIKAMARNIRRLRKDTDYLIKNYDEGDVGLHRRLVKVEQHLGISSAE